MSVAAEICSVCDGISLEPRGFCPLCGTREVSLGAIPGEGVIWSITQIHRPPASDGAANGPYWVALIALSAGPRLMARVSGGAAIGDPVLVTRDRIDSPTTHAISMTI